MRARRAFLVSVVLAETAFWSSCASTTNGCGDGVTLTVR